MRLRSVLFAPADRPDLLRKLPRSEPDAVVIDCEDGTALAAKSEAREHARVVGDEIAGEVAVWVRVNGTETDWFDGDIRWAIGDRCSGIVVPVVESQIQLDAVLHAFEAVGRPPLPVIAGLETARGVADARDILTHQSVAAAYFGAEDYIADLGGVRTESNLEVLHARSEVALAGRLTQVPVLDQVVVAFQDESRFRREAAEARAMGYAGKMCIHPSQVLHANDAFTPGTAEVTFARRVIAAHAAAQREGRGVSVVDGRMIDEPLVAQARRTLELAGLSPSDDGA